MKVDNIEIVRIIYSKTNKIAKNLWKSKNLKNTKSKIPMCIYIGAIEEPIFLIYKARDIINCLKQLFIKALIFWHFDLKCHIYIKSNKSKYAINRILNQLNFD